MGSSNGVFRIYPSLTQKCDGSYDPRFRPWYVAATTGKKNVIILLENSVTMNSSRLAKAKKAAESVIDTLGNGDAFGVVVFN